jgi:hypothetical protein
VDLQPQERVNGLDEEAIAKLYALGFSIRRLSMRFQVSRDAIRRILHLRRSRRLEALELVFPVGVFSPTSAPTPIRRGDPAICMVSHQCGLDYVPPLQRHMHDEPAPETKTYRPDPALRGGVVRKRSPRSL